MIQRASLLAIWFLCIGAVWSQSTGSASLCPKVQVYAKAPPANCQTPTDPNKKPPSKLEQWFTKAMFNDLFPYANLGFGPDACLPYSYESFVIAARYFPHFGTSNSTSTYSATESARRDVAAFFSHAVQETGMNDASLYASKPEQEASNCFYRGGFFNWFEGGPTSSFLDHKAPGYTPADGNVCNSAGLYCSPDNFYPCSNAKNGLFNTGCYFGRGAIQISYNYNYGQFQDWLATQNIKVDLLKNPNLVMTSMNPPLAILASLWFYMTPQPPKPSMHDIVTGKWNAGPINQAAGYLGPIFGPTSLIINNECGGEDPVNPGGAGESRRIKAFKWFCSYFQVPVGAEKTLTCKGMPQQFSTMTYPISYQLDWSTSWKEQPCQCAPASYGGIIPYFDPAYYPAHFVALNEQNKKRCVTGIYANTTTTTSSQTCMKYPPK